MSGWDVVRSIVLSCRWQRNMSNRYLMEAQDGVKYFDRDDRSKHCVNIIAGVVYNHGKMVSRRKNEELATSSRLWFDQGRFGYVLAYDDKMQKNLYLFVHRDGMVHHSSVCSGRPVIDAGMMTIVNGRIVYIEHKSGHYKPNFEQLRHTLAFLQIKGVDLGSVFVSRRIEGAIKNAPIFTTHVMMGLLKLYSARDVFSAQDFDSIPEVRGIDMDNIDAKTRVAWEAPQITKL